MPEKRHFQRYESRHPVRVGTGGSTLTAELVDYSFGGLGVRFKDYPRKDDVLRVESAELTHPVEAKIVWGRKTPEGLRAGLLRLDAFRGSLKHYRLSDIFMGFQRSQKTGVFNFKSGPAEKKIYVKDGDLIFAASNCVEDRLGDVLLREGRITREEFDRSSELIRKTGRRQGAILVEMGCLAAGELLWAVRHQVETIISSLFNFDGGDMEFAEGPLLTDEVITLKLSAGSLIYNGIKKSSSRNHEEYFGLRPDTVLGISPDPSDACQGVTLDDTDKKFLSLMDGTRMLKKVAAMSGFDGPAAKRTAAALLSVHMARVVGKGTAPKENNLPKKSPSERGTGDKGTGPGRAGRKSP